MLKIVSYLAVFILAVAIMIVTDEDPTSVSIMEWVMFAVMAYSANELRELLVKAYRRGSWD